MGLMRCLYFIAAKFKLHISALHLAGKANTLADTLSRNNASHFLSTLPQASQQPTAIPTALTDLLVGTKPDWTSPDWSRMFSFIFRQLSPEAQCAPTPLATTATPTSAQDTAINPSGRQRPSSASSLAFLDNRDSNTKPSNHTSPTSVSSTSSMVEETPSFARCPSSNTSYEVSSPKKRRKITHQSHASNTSSYSYPDTPSPAKRSHQL